MAPPSYADLGKAARDLFTKGYNIGLLKVDVTSKAGVNQEVEFQTGAVHAFTSGAFTGNLDLKYKIPSYGITLTEKWNTDNVLSNLIEVQDQICKGLKLTLDTSYAPQRDGKRTGKVKAELARDNVRVECDVGLDTEPMVNLSFVAEHSGFLFGAKSSLDMGAGRIGATNVSLGMKGIDYALLAYMNNRQDFGASLFHQPAMNFELGVDFGWSLGDSTPRFGIASKYVMSKDLEVKTKLTSDANLGFVATHYLSSELKLVMSTQIALTRMLEGGQKFGLGIDYSA